MRNGRIGLTSTGLLGSTSRKNSAFVGLLIFLFVGAAARAEMYQSHAPRPVPPLVYEDAEGQQHALRDFRGRFVLLNLWATWCSPCISEMPSLDDLQAAFGPDLAVVALAQSQPDATVLAFYQSHKIQHLPVAIDRTGRASAAFGVRGLPTTILLNRNGQEVARFEGGLAWDSQNIRTFLRREMSAQPLVQKQ